MFGWRYWWVEKNRIETQPPTHWTRDVLWIAYKWNSFSFYKLTRILTAHFATIIFIPLDASHVAATRLTGFMSSSILYTKVLYIRYIKLAKCFYRSGWWWSSSSLHLIATLWNAYMYGIPNSCKVHLNEHEFKLLHTRVARTFLHVLYLYYTLLVWATELTTRSHAHTHTVL